ncbi:MAG: hypothetical protein II267_03915 [Paludibacteraceae bacterium]|nr:hypothetical protein [Paludibacteraceae bacterium]MBQ2439019.1 hypothetical protein [Paludibacteraceae bacterium]
MKKFAEFVCLVGTMRQAQNKYFQTREKKDLYRCWDLEKKVDATIIAMMTAPGSENEKNTPNGSSEEETPNRATEAQQTTDKPPF